MSCVCVPMSLPLCIAPVFVVSPLVGGLFVVCVWFLTVMFCWFIFFVLYGAGGEVDGEGDGFMWGKGIVFLGFGL